MMNLDGSTRGPLAAWGASHQCWLKGGETAAGYKSTQPRWREDTWGICLFIYSHMLYPLQCYSESAQWGKENAPSTLWGRAGISASRAAYSNFQHRKWTSGEFWMGTKLFWHFTLGQWACVFFLLPTVQCSSLSTMQSWDWKKADAIVCVPDWLYLTLFQVQPNG